MFLTLVFFHNHSDSAPSSSPSGTALKKSAASRLQRYVHTQNPAPSGPPLLAEKQIDLPPSSPATEQDSEQTRHAGKMSVQKPPRVSTSSKPSHNPKSGKVQFTPLEQQYMSIKASYPDAILFVECGFKYRFFGEDSEIASKVLKIGSFPDHNFVTGSIPAYRLNIHLRRYYYDKWTSLKS